MAKLPPLKRIHQEDVPEGPKWLQKILIPINSFFQNVWQALDHGLTLQDNFDVKIVDVTFVGGQVLELPNNLSRPITAILAAQSSIGGQVVWRQIGDKIEISNLTGATPGVSYAVRLIIL